MFAMALEKERKKIFQEGKTEGELLGLQKGKIETARNLLDIFDNETISEKTGIPLEQIKQQRNGNPRCCNRN